MRRKQRHTWFALKRVRSLHRRRMKSLPRRAVSFQFVYDNVIDIIPYNGCQSTLFRVSYPLQRKSHVCLNVFVNRICQERPSRTSLKKLASRP